MKTTLIYFCIALLQVALCAPNPEISDEQATQACLVELKIDESTIRTLDALEDFDETNPNCGKLLSCTWKKLGLQDENGNVYFEKLGKYLSDYTQQRVDAGLSKTAASEATVAQWLDSCRSFHGTDHAQVALKVHFCLAKGIKNFIKSH